jgi:hypothetical protein
MTLKAGGADERMKAAKKVRKLADKVLSARVRMLKTRLVVLGDAGATGAMPGYAKDLDTLRQRLADTRDQGVAAILKEFSAEEAGLL